MIIEKCEVCGSTKIEETDVDIFCTNCGCVLSEKNKQIIPDFNDIPYGL